MNCYSYRNGVLSDSSVYEAGYPLAVSAGRFRETGNVRVMLAHLVAGCIPLAGSKIGADGAHPAPGQRHR